LRGGSGLFKEIEQTGEVPELRCYHTG
jgi:hypothetical protein